MTRHNNRHILRMAAMLLGFIGLTACSQDDNAPGGNYDLPTGKPHKVQIALNLDGDIDTRADWDYNLRDNEKIHCWTLVFAARCGINEYQVIKTTELHNVSGASTSEMAEAEVPFGNYLVLAICNSTVNQYDIADKLNGYTYSVSGITYKGDVNHIQQSDDVPMTGFAKMEITKAGVQSTPIKLCRVAAKLTYNFKNSSKYEITVKKLEWNINREAKNMSGMPNYTYMLENTRKIMNRDVAETLCMNDGAPGLSWDLRNVKARPGSSASWFMYCRGGLMMRTADNPYGELKLTATIARGGEDETHSYIWNAEDPGPIERREWPICWYRNDHVTIPVTFTNYNVSLSVSESVPIAGTPTVETRDDGFWYVVFKTNGEVSIRPVVRDAMTDEIIDPRLVTVQIKNVKQVQGNNFFSKTLTYNSSTGEIEGVVNSNPGSVRLDVSIRVKEALGSSVAEEFERTAFLIHN